MQSPEPLPAFPNARCLRSSLHVASKRHEDFSTLGSRIISKKASWGPNAKIHGDFEFINHYWEWTEDVLFHYQNRLQKAKIYDAVYASLYTYDHNKEIIRAFCEAWCPSTNTLHISDGEASISLWDLHRLGGLPLDGAYYDEIIPCTEELTGLGRNNGKGFIPGSCEYLFAAFYFLKQKEGGVSISSWIDFWFESESRYSKPPARRTRKSRFAATHNPNGVLSEHQGRLKAGSKAFSTLDIRDALKHESYLAAFLSCWICAFVLPGRDASIRPETFKTAALMAFGDSVNLAIPVLVSIYRGLNQLAQSTQASHSDACFPLHYVTGWISFYFKTHYENPHDVSGPPMVKYSGENGARNYKEVDARKRIYNDIDWSAVPHIRNRDEVFVDDSDICYSDLNFFVSIRSYYLPTRSNQVIMVEPYSPHRFGRQFGFCQDIPGVLKENKRSGSYDDLYKLWMLCTRTRTKSKLYAPARSLKIGEQKTPRYEAWWSKVHDAYFKYSIDTLVLNARAPAMKRKNAPKGIIEPKPSEEKAKVSDHSSLKEKQVSSPEMMVQPTSSSTDVCEGEVVKTKQRLPSCGSAEGSDDRHWKRQRTKKILDDERSSTQSGASITNQLKADDVQTTNTVQENVSPDAIVDNALIVKKPPSEASKSINSESSQFSADDIISKSQLQLATTLWEGIQPKIVQMTLEEAPALLGEVRKVLDVMTAIKCVDSSSLRSMVEEYFENMKKFKHLDSFISSRMSLKEQTEKIEALNVRLEEATALEHKAISDVKSLHSDIAAVEKEIISLQTRKHELESLMVDTEAELKDKKTITSNLCEEITLVKSSPTYSESDAEGMDLLQGALETGRRDLETFR